MKQKCKTCGRNCEGSHCFLHKSRKPLPTGKTFKKTIPNNENRQELSEMGKFFLEIWGERKHYSEVSGEYLSSPASSLYFHHIFSKEKHLELKFCKDNIILLSLLEHGNVEGNMYKYDEINKRRNQLTVKYDL